MAYATDDTGSARIANTIGNVLDAADEPPDTWGRHNSRPPLQRDDIVAARDVLLVLAARLREPGYLPPRAVALAAMLVWDSASSMYAPGTGTSVAEVAEQVLDLMGQPREWLAA